MRPALCLHLRQYRLGNAQDAEDVGVEQRLGLVDGGFLCRTEQCGASIVDQYVDAPSFCNHMFDALANRGFVTNIQVNQLDTGDGLRSGRVARAAERGNRVRRTVRPPCDRCLMTRRL